MNVEELILNYKEKNTKIWIVLSLVFILATYYTIHFDRDKIKKINNERIHFRNQNRQLFDDYRKICLSKLKKQIIIGAESLSLRNKTALFVDLPDHMNYGIF